MPYYKHGHSSGNKAGVSPTTEYTIWQMMKDRCLNPNAPNYHRYGGRGVTIDPPWLVFLKFHADMGQRPSRYHTLHRIDNNGPYSKGNCKWATAKEQGRNRSDNKLTQQDVDAIRASSLSCRAIAPYYGVTYGTISKIRRWERWA